MQMSKRVGMAAWVAAPIFGVMAATSAAAAPEVCNWKTARDAANSGDYAAMCECTHVTPSFLQRLQNRSDFATTLQNTGAMCPGLASLLTDLPTASINTASDSRGEDRDSDQLAQLGPVPPGGGGGSGPGNGGGGGDDPGNGGGGGDDPGNGGGGDDPGNGGGGDDPGNGGGGGDGPGKGGGKGGDGKGGGKGGDGKGGGKGGDGKGGGKGGDGKGGGKGGGKGKR